MTSYLLFPQFLSAFASQTQDLPKDCQEVKDRGNMASGEYMISPPEDDEPPFRVYCDMDTDGGGWTVGL